MATEALQSLRRRRGPALFLALHLAALGLFVHGFLLTRVHLPQRSAHAAGGAAPNATAPYDRVVWLMIDALRYDMVLADGRYRCTPDQAVCHQGHMPFLAGLARSPAARAFMFVSDAPTTTTQRLKALATGGLPSFFDVSNSFSAGALGDDNLVDQLAAAGRRMAFLGDTTWAQLFPSQWAWSRPYPCFNVRDLHTVDDGVWAHLLPALRAAPPPQALNTDAGEGEPQGAASWDGLLVAHYLGADHCGHSHGVGSAEMADKLRQMDDHVRQVAAALLEGAAPGGPYERTLLLVSGDHGQTLGGDHGGGSPEEVDSALVAVDVKSLWRQQQQQQQQEEKGGGEGLAAPAPCRATCTCGVERNQCAPDLAQTDLTPTLAALLGVPIPFGNLGKLSTELWQLAEPRLGGSSEGGGGGRAAWERSLLDALLANARQVHTYLHTYAATSGASFSRAALAGLDRLYAAADGAAGLDRLYAAANGVGADVAGAVARCHAYLEAAAAVAREQWTQFGDVSMLAGLALFAATVVLQAATAFGSAGGQGGDAAPVRRSARGPATRASARRAAAGDEPPEKNGDETAAAATADGADAAAASSGHVAAFWRQLHVWQLVAPWRPGSRVPVPTLRAWLAATALLHALGVFSFFYLLTEGKNVCILVAAACLALALATGRAARAAGQGVRGVAALGIASLRFNALMAVLGVAHHTGQGFWARLTVHDPQPEGDVERGWHGKLAKLKAFGALLMARSGLDQLHPTALALAHHTLACTLPLAALAALTERLQRGGGRSALQRLATLAAFASAAAYLQLEDATQRGLLPAGITLSQLVQGHAWPLLPAALASQLSAAASALQPVLQAWPAAALYGAQLAALPLQVLLPNATYALCGVGAALWLLAVLTGRLRGADAATAAAQLVLAVLVQVSDGQAPLILLLGLLEVAVIARLLAKRAELAPEGTSAAGVGGEAGALLALVSAQLFYATGHMCEFAGLQYTAGFVGSDEFHLWRSGALVVLNTFGAMLAACLALPGVVAYVQSAAAAASAGKKGAAARRGKGSKGGGGGRDEALHQAVLVAGLVRALAAFCAALSAGVQRRHLYAWALFAPRFAFEAAFLLLTDLALLLVAALA